MRLYLIATVIAISTAFAANAAEGPRDINWENLAPKYIPIDDPFTHLSPDQRLDLFAILGIRKQVEEGLTPKEGPTYQIGIEMTTKLKSQGLQVEALVRKAREIERIIAEQDRKTVPELQGQNSKFLDLRCRSSSRIRGLRSFCSFRILAPVSTRHRRRPIRSSWCALWSHISSTTSTCPSSLRGAF